MNGTNGSGLAPLALADAGRSPDEPATAPPAFRIYSNGFCHCSVCTTLSAEEATERVNLENPTGLREGRWSITDTHFHTGESNPCACSENPQTHKHYLFTC